MQAALQRETKAEKRINVRKCLKREECSCALSGNVTLGGMRVVPCFFTACLAVLMFWRFMAKMENLQKEELFNARKGHLPK